MKSTLHIIIRVNCVFFRLFWAKNPVPNILRVFCFDLLDFHGAHLHVISFYYNQSF
ncbi:putative N-acetyltransferase YitI [Listeria monocytogenes]|nr:putative N-acetyltransferase YitI [Listeria monocytogenes]